MSDESIELCCVEQRVDFSDLFWTVILPVLGILALSWDLLRWRDVFPLLAGLAAIVVVTRSVRFEIDESGINAGWLFSSTRIQWDEAERLTVSKFGVSLLLRCGRKCYRISRWSEHFDAVAEAMLHLVGEQCEIDPKVHEALKRWRDPERHARSRRKFAAIFAILGIAAGWAIWQTHVIGGVCIWIHVIGLLASVVLASYGPHAEGRLERQLVGLFTAWNALSLVSMSFAIFGDIDRLMVAGFGNLAAMCGAFVLATEWPNVRRRCVTAATTSVLVLTIGAPAYWTVWSPYRSRLIRVYGMRILEYVTWNAATDQTFAVASSLRSDEDYDFVATSRNRQTGQTRRFSRKNLRWLWPSPQGNYVVLQLIDKTEEGKEEKEETSELWLVDSRLSQTRQVFSLKSSCSPSIMWSPDEKRFLYVQTENCCQSSYQVVDRATLLQRRLDLPNDRRVLEWNGNDRLWTSFRLDDQKDQALEEREASRLLIEDHPVAAGPPSHPVMRVDEPCGWIRPTSQPGLFVSESKKGYLIADTRLGQSFPWPTEAAEPVMFGGLPVLTNRRHALVVSENKPRELLLVDWQNNRSTVLWRAPSAGFDVDRRIHFAPDERRVALWIEKLDLHFIGTRSCGWLIVPLEPRGGELQWIGIPGLPLMVPASTHPAFGTRGHWLDSRHFLLQHIRVNPRAPDFIEGLDLFVLPID